MSSVKSRVLVLRERFNKEKVTDEDRIVILKELMTINIDKATLKATSIGKIINKHRKSENAELSGAVKAVVSYWKKLVLKGNKSPSTPSTPTLSTPPLPSPKVKPEKSVTKESKAKKSFTTEVKAEKQDPALAVKHSLGTGNKVRDKIQDLIMAGFSAGIEMHTKTNLTVRIERELFKKHGSTGSEYKDQFRSILFNLRNKSNPMLLRNVVKGSITPQDLVSKDAQELASEEMQRKREAERKYAIDSARCDWDQNVKDSGWSDFFSCPECLGDKTKYNQKQIRGADEPMTTFVVCGDCGHRWTDGDH